MIAFEFDRAKVRRWLTIQSLIFVGSVTLFALFSQYIVPHLPEGSWASAGVQGSALAAQLLIIYAVCVIGFSRRMRERRPALIVNRAGIVDNASNYVMGEIAWAEIDKMYSQDWITRLFGSQSPKMPIIKKQHGIVVVLKDTFDFHSRLQRKSWIMRSSFREQFRKGNKPWLFIPETLLDTHADEVIERLNEFYVAQVRAS